MQIDFHYYATYSAAYIAGYSHEEACDIAYSAFFVDQCTNTLLTKLNAPKAAITTQLQMELMDASTDVVGLQNITRIWSSFHFLPGDLYATKEKCSKKYLRKYRLICKPNGSLLKDTVELAKGAPLQAVGVAMHVLADTWAHMYFAGTPSLAINNVNSYLYEFMPDDSKEKIELKHNPIVADDAEKKSYSASIFQSDENSIMNLGHGRIGHLPDYSYCRYSYLPSWGGYKEVFKDNPSDYRKAYAQMIYSLKYLRGEIATFETDTYDFDAIASYEQDIEKILWKRQILACDDWKAFGEKISGAVIPDYDIGAYQDEYMDSSNKDDTFLGRFFNASIRQKSMVTKRIYDSGSMLAGYSVTPKRTELAAKMMKNAVKAGDDDV